MNIHKALAQLSIGLMTAILISACGTTASPKPNYYILNALASDSPTLRQQPLPHAIVLQSLELPPYLDRGPIVTRQSANQLQINEFDLWGGNLRKNLSRILASNLRHLLGGTDIATSPARNRDQQASKLRIQVERFEREPNGNIQLHAHWWYQGQSHSSQHQQTLAPAANINTTVEAMNRLIDQLSLRIAEQIESSPH